MVYMWSPGSAQSQMRRAVIVLDGGLESHLQGFNRFASRV